MPDKDTGDTRVIQPPVPPIQDISGKGQEQGEPQPKPKLQAQVQDIQLKVMNNLLMIATCNPTRTYARGKEVILCSSIDLKPQNEQQYNFVDTLASLYGSGATYIHLEQNPDGSVCVSFYTGVYKPKP